MKKTKNKWDNVRKIILKKLKAKPMFPWEILEEIRKIKPDADSSFSSNILHQLLINNKIGYTLPYENQLRLYNIVGEDKNAKNNMG